MKSKHLIDPELLAGLERLPSIDFSPDLLPMIRQGFELMAAEIPESPDAKVEERKLVSSAGHEIGILIHSPTSPGPARPAVLHIHGGGYIIGSAKMSMASNLKKAIEADCVVVSVDYRLAPETTHPGPVEDCYEALKWLHENAPSLGIDAARIAVEGESAGAGLAAALALLARDRGEIALIHQHLIYPMLDDRTCIAETPPYAGEFVWTPKSNFFGWSSLLGRTPGEDGISCYAAAARAEDLSGLPSTFIAVGALDLFAGEDIEYARRLLLAGVPTELHVYPGAYHGFELAGDAQVTLRAQHNSISALRRALHAPSAAADPA
jgi:acetyl esterase/lipase